VRERTWHHSQEIHELPNDEIELKLTLTSTVEIAQWILSWGDHAKALAPMELVKTITKTLGATMRRYSTS